jgi:hypothetical protein
MILYSDFIEDSNVQFYANFASFPITGLPDILYIDSDTGTTYVWDPVLPGYITAAAVPTNIYNSDGTLTGNRVLSGGTNSLTFQDVSSYDLVFNQDGYFSVGDPNYIAWMYLRQLGTSSLFVLDTRSIDLSKHIRMLALGDSSGSNFSISYNDSNPFNVNDLRSGSFEISNLGVRLRAEHTSPFGFVLLLKPSTSEATFQDNTFLKRGLMYSGFGESDVADSLCLANYSSLTNTSFKSLSVSSNFILPKRLAPVIFSPILAVIA